MQFLRRKYFIYPEIQKPILKIGLTSVILMSLFQIVSFFAVMLWIEKKTQVTMDILVDYRIYGLWKYFILAAILIPVVFNLIISFVFSLYISNKFAGPLYRIEKEIDQHLNQESSFEKKPLHIQLRQYDYLKSLAHKINLLTK